MYLKTLISPEHVILNLQGNGQQEILDALVEPLNRDGLLTDADVFVQDLLKREEQITTQVGSGVAFPHARSVAVRRLALVVGVAPEPGLVFNLSVAEPCRIFFLIAIPSLAPTAHLPLLQRLANFAHDRKHTDKLLGCTTPAKVAQCLASFKG